VMVVVLAGAVGIGVLLQDQQSLARGESGPSVVERTVPPRSPEPGSPTVALAEDVVLHPGAERVRQVVQQYFDAINAGDYKLWSGAVIPQWARDTGEAAWRAQYRSTLDGSIVVHRLEPRAGGGLVALTSFTSLQDPTDAPPELPVRCLRWWVSYPLFGEGEALRLGPSSPAANRLVAC
jgi:hypothetical protein